MKTKICFVGKAGSGKSTLADFMKKEYRFKDLHFAMPVKEIAYKYFDATEKNRELLQKIGGLMRTINPLVWVNCMKRSIETSPHFMLVIDDCRYINEAKMLKELGFTLIKLEGRQWELPEKQANDASETELEKIMADYILDTSKPLETTQKELMDIIYERI